MDTAVALLYTYIARGKTPRLFATNAVQYRTPINDKKQESWSRLDFLFQEWVHSTLT